MIEIRGSQEELYVMASVISIAAEKILFDDETQSGYCFQVKCNYCPVNQYCESGLQECVKFIEVNDENNENSDKGNCKSD